MYKVLIIDDEVVIREGLRIIVDWKKHGFLICGEGVNGRDGLKKIEDLRPDLVITDIKMPQISGLEMIEKIREIGNKCRVILLTGYSDFDYARGAIKNGVEGYLLKPIDEDELERLLEKVKLKLDTEIDILRMATDNVMQSIIFGDVKDKQIVEYNKLYSLSLPWRKYQIIIIDISINKNNEKKTFQTIRKYVMEFVNDAKYGCVFETEGYLCILFKDTEFNINNMHPINLLYKYIRNINKVGITIAIGKPVNTLPEVAFSYKTAKKFLTKKFIYGASSIVCYTNTENQQDERITAIDIEQLAEKLYISVSTSQMQYAISTMDEYKNTMIENNISEDRIKAYYTKLYNLLISKLVKNNQYKYIFGGNIDEESDVIGELYSYSDINSLNKYLTNIILIMCKRTMNNDPENAMKRILSYIDDNYKSNIKLDMISEVFGYNSIYLGKKFKEYTEMSFNTYLNKVRIENAKKLLKMGSKIYEVAEEVGYCDKDYL